MESCVIETIMKVYKTKVTKVDCGHKEKLCHCQLMWSGKGSQKHTYTLDMIFVVLIRLPSRQIGKMTCAIHLVLRSWKRMYENELCEFQPHVKCKELRITHSFSLNIFLALQLSLILIFTPSYKISLSHFHPLTTKTFGCCHLSCWARK